ncbi:MAG: cytochrome C [Salaquimonas sp.]
MTFAAAWHAAAQQVSLPDKLVGHGGPVKAVQINLSGDQALTSSFDYSIMFWSLQNGKAETLHRMIGHNAAVNDIAFVPARENFWSDNEIAVSVSDDGAFGIWDLKSGEAVSLIKDGEEKMLDVTASSYGTFAAAAKWDGSARVYDLETRKEIYRFEGHKGPVNSVAFSPNSNALFSTSYDGDIRFWRVREPETPDQYSILQHGAVIHSNGWGVNVMQALPDGTGLLFGTVNGLVGVLDIQSRKVTELGTYEHPILSLAISEKAGWIAAGSGDGFIRVYDLASKELIEQRQDAYGPVWGMAFSADGKQIFKAGLDDFVGQWQISPRKPIELSQSEFPRRFQVRNSEDPGESEFQRKCSVCHTLVPNDKNRAGPTLYKLFGRKAGTVPGYVYSPALLNSGIIWTEETVSRLFDEGPDIVTPGTKMPIQRLKSVERRNDLIAYLKRASEVGEE